MDVISNANHAGGVAYLSFDAKPDGRACQYRLMGLMEGLVLPSFLQDHFQMNDFTPFHDEIRKISTILWWENTSRAFRPPCLPPDDLSLGIFHSDSAGNFGFYYMLSRTGMKALPTVALLVPSWMSILPTA